MPYFYRLMRYFVHQLSNCLRRPSEFHSGIKIGLSAVDGKILSMGYYILKTILSAIIIVSISELSKRSSLIGGILASLPLVSFLGILWLYWDTKDTEKVASLSTSIFWLVIPSLSFFIALPLFLKNKMGFTLSFSISTLIMFISYFGMVFVLNRFGIKL
jgi:hypothetical protein